MKQGFEAENAIDSDGNPTGGSVRGMGIKIDWQDGPLGRHAPDCVVSGRPSCSADCTRVPPNGAFVEDVIDAALQRIQFLNNASDGRFRCRENSLAITKLEEALHWLDARTQRRESAGTEGTYTSN